MQTTTHNWNSLEAWLATVPVEVHYANFNVTREPFLYASILQDADSYQARDPAIAALEPGLTALWLDKAAACCAAGGSVIDVGSHFHTLATFHCWARREERGQRERLQRRRRRQLPPNPAPWPFGQASKA
jgi:hypothetical protein